MKRSLAVFGAALIGICLSVLPAFGEEISLKPDGDGKWLMHGENGNLVGTITKTEDKSYRIENAAGTFRGNIWSNGTWTPDGAWRKRRLVVTPEGAQLYLDALAALKSAKVL
ncbi:MAG: hypothetical protein IMF18_07660 [Proteobacteria bacterium]|nr:hypothetical protein [Pseudomonadota bacterium]